MPDNCNNQVLSAEQVAHELGISRSAVYTLFRQKNFPSVRVTDKRIVCFRQDLEKWIAQRKMLDK